MTTDVVATGVEDSAMEETHPALVTMIRQMKASAAMVTQSGDFVMDLMEKILQADTFEDIFDAAESGMISGKDFAGRPFVVASADAVQIRPSNKTENGGFPFYAVLNVTEIATGEETVINCGGKTFMPTLWALLTKGYFEEERALTILSVPSDAGAYLLLKPYRRPEVSAKKNGKATDK